MGNIMDKFINLPETINNLIVGVLEGLFNSLLGFIGSAYSGLMGTAENLLDNSVIQQVIFYSQTLALTILIIKVMFEGFQTYIMYQNGDPESDPTGLLVRTGQAVAIIASLPFIIKELFHFGVSVGSDIVGLVGFDFDVFTFNSILSQLGGADSPVGGGEILAFLIAGLIAIVLLFIVMIQASIRGAELALMAVIGSFLALNISQNNRGTWEQYIKKIIVLVLTQALQIFMIQMAIILFTVGLTNPFKTMGMIGWLWVTAKTPQYLKEFTHSTGVAGGIASGGRTAGQHLLMRKAMGR